MSTDKKMEIVFAPGCFDSFEGSQEELDNLISEIQRMVDTGEIFEKSREIDFDNPSEEDIEVIEHLMSIEEDKSNRKIQ